MWFLFSSRCFLIVATLTIVWFLQYESYFFIFCVFSFLRQKSPKIDAKTRSQKIIKKWWSGHPFWIPKSMKMDVGRPEKRTNCKKMSFFEGTVFWSFFWYVFSWILGAPGVSGGSRNRDFRLFFRVVCVPGFLRPFWVDFGSIQGRFWIDFGSILGRFLVDFVVDFESIFGRFVRRSWIDFGSLCCGACFLERPLCEESSD